MPKRMVVRDGPHPVDTALGRRIRERRTTMGISQTKLAEAIGITFQQVQKYERGANRVSASALFEIAAALKTSPAKLFDGLGRKSASSVSKTDRSTLALNDAFRRIKSRAVRRSVVTFVRGLAGRT